MTSFIEMKGITKLYPGVRANNAIDFDIGEGEIHALLGENGAGKTTLMQILYGLVAPTEGSISVGGKPVEFRSPADAIAAGISLVQQHFSLVGVYSVVENVLLAREPSRYGVLYDRPAAKKIVQGLCQKYNLHLDIDSPVKELSVGDQQKVELLKAFYRGAKVLILDEPTAVLTPQQVDDLYVTMREFRESGNSIVFITHKLKECLTVSDRVSVLQAGSLVQTLRAADTDAAQLARMMVGRDLAEMTPRRAKALTDQVLLSARNLRVNGDNSLEAVRGVSLELRKGEILGVAGVQGNGQIELAEALAGVRPIVAGELLINGKRFNALDRKGFIAAGVGYVPENRHRDAWLGEASIEDNLILGYQDRFTRYQVLMKDRIGKYARRLVEEYDIRLSALSAPGRSLSGGNQQKAVMSRIMSQSLDILIACQPTRGLDISATEFVRSKLVEARDAGMAVLIVSYDLDEIKKMSDRIAVIYEGQIVDNRPFSEFSEKDIGLQMAGASRV